ncbi:hypothetical protein [Halorubrum trueperi]|uniref:Uncharacterized protein n=1 Tax=Halorubrum trueperi TaxID=2004704 RepID=A0ABD5USR8_9EURY
MTDERAAATSTHRSAQGDDLYHVAVGETVGSANLQVRAAVDTVMAGQSFQRFITAQLVREGSILRCPVERKTVAG